jgi:hypothetical protein
MDDGLTQTEATQSENDPLGGAGAARSDGDHISPVNRRGTPPNYFSRKLWLEP